MKVYYITVLKSRLKCQNGVSINPKQLETHRCVLCPMVYDSLELQNSTIGTHNADWIFISLYYCHAEMVYLVWAILENNSPFEKKWPSCVRVNRVAVIWTHHHRWIEPGQAIEPHPRHATSAKVGASERVSERASERWSERGSEWASERASERVSEWVVGCVRACVSEWVSDYVRESVSQSASSTRTSGHKEAHCALVVSYQTLWGSWSR